MYEDFQSKEIERLKKISEIENELKDDNLLKDQERAAKEKELSDLRLEATELELSALQSSFGIAKTLFKENTAAYKAMAVAESTIATYLAATKALSVPPPFGQILAGIITAAGLANVAKILGVGFKKGGYTGDGSDSDVAGVVHKKEYVVNAKSYKRNKDLIQAMESNKLDKYFVSEYGDLVKSIANKKIKDNIKNVRLKSNLAINQNGELIQLSKSINSLERKLEVLSFNVDRKIGVQIESKSKIKGSDLELISSKIKDKKAVRF